MSALSLPLVTTSQRPWKSPHSISVKLPAPGDGNLPDQPRLGPQGFPIISVDRPVPGGRTRFFMSIDTGLSRSIFSHEAGRS